MGDQQLLLGLDVGTSVIKAALFDRAGREIAAASQRTRLSSPHPGWSEAHMPSTWEIAARTLRQLLELARVQPNQVAGVGLAGNMIGAWMIDADGQPVRNAILWNDGRTHDLLARMEAQSPDFRSYVFGFSGSLIEYGCTLPVVAWLAEHEPHSLARTHAILRSKDWIRFKLTGQIATDVSEVPGLPGDVRRRDYSPELMRLFGIDAYANLFPPIVPSESVTGTIQAEAAALTGLREGTPVSGGVGDVPAVALGVGAVEPGMACSILGTHCINGIMLDQPGFEPPNVGLLFTIPGDRWMRALTNVAGTTNLDWVIKGWWGVESGSITPEIFAAAEREAASSPPGANGVLYHPYLSAVGIIAPEFIPEARAQFFGLRPDHTRGDLVRAVYEGVALAIRECYAATGAALGEVRLSGGGARSPLWCQIIADVLGVRVVVPSGSEFGAKGAALTVGVGIGWYPSIADAARSTLTIARAYDPSPDHKALYDRHFTLYREIRRALIPLWKYAAQT